MLSDEHVIHTNRLEDHGRAEKGRSAGGCADCRSGGTLQGFALRGRRHLDAGRAERQSGGGQRRGTGGLLRDERKGWTGHSGPGRCRKQAGSNRVSGKWNSSSVGRRHDKPAFAKSHVCAPSYPGTGHGLYSSREPGSRRISIWRGRPFSCLWQDWLWR